MAPYFTTSFWLFFFFCVCVCVCVCLKKFLFTYLLWQSHAFQNLFWLFTETFFLSLKYWCPQEPKLKVWLPCTTYEAKKWIKKKIMISLKQLISVLASPAGLWQQGGPLTQETWCACSMCGSPRTVWSPDHTCHWSTLSCPSAAQRMLQWQ